MSDLNRWKLSDGREILLYTSAELAILPDNTPVVAVDGITYVTPRPDWDEERYGYSAYGYETEPEPEGVALSQHPYGDVADMLDIKEKIEREARKRVFE